MTARLSLAVHYDAGNISAAREKSFDYRAKLKGSTFNFIATRMILMLASNHESRTSNGL
jgi:hypothetical protein